MDIIIVGNILKDVYLNLDSRTENYETDRNDVKWLNLSFNASEHHFFNRSSNFGGAAVTLETLQKMGLPASISDSKLNFLEEQSEDNIIPSAHRYILISENDVTYFAPSKLTESSFNPPAEAVKYLFIDRSASLNLTTVQKINAYLDLSRDTKLVLYVRDVNDQNLLSLVPRSSLIFLEDNGGNSEKTYALQLFPEQKTIHISEKKIIFNDVTEKITTDRINLFTHLSAYSVVAATILGGFVMGLSVEESFKLARAGVENAKVNSALSLKELQEIASTYDRENNLELIAANLVISKKGILAADESGGSIKKKFASNNIPDTYEKRREYRDILLTTPDLENYVNGVILFEETAYQKSESGQSFVDLLISKRIIPGIKVDQGLAPLTELIPDASPDDTYTKGLEDLETRLQKYYDIGLRFAKWRAAFTMTPSDAAIDKNCEILAKYAKICQENGFVPIVEPEVIYDGNYSLEECAKTTARILDNLFSKLKTYVNLKACLLKVNMILAGKQYKEQTPPEIVGQTTAEILKKHVPSDLAGIVFLSGGQTPEQATKNLAEIVKNGPFPWPVTFSFARALQDPALLTWAGDNRNIDAAKKAFQERLIANTEILN